MKVKLRTIVFFCNQAQNSSGKPVVTITINLFLNISTVAVPISRIAIIKATIVSIRAPSLGFRYQSSIFL